MNTKVFYLDENNIDDGVIKEAAKVIRSSGTVVIPTETVYGLGANALSSEAALKIFSAKGRPSDNPLIVHISCIDMLVYVIGETLSDRAKLLIEKYWPGPLTLIFKKSKNVPAEVTAGLETVAVRMPDNPVALKLIEASGVPIAAPSANISGKPSPTLAEHVVADMSGRVDMILCGSKSRVGVESTVLDISGEIPVILRPGGVTYEELSALLGKVDIDVGLESELAVPKAPGMKYTHYAPDAKMYIVRGMETEVKSRIQSLIDDNLIKGHKVGVMSANETKDSYQGCSVIAIGSRDEAEEAAANVFAALRQFDKLGVDIIYAEAFEEKNMGLAVMNRLKKAAGFNIIEV